MASNGTVGLASSSSSPKLGPLNILWTLLHSRATTGPTGYCTSKNGGIRTSRTRGRIRMRMRMLRYGVCPGHWQPRRQRPLRGRGQGEAEEGVVPSSTPISKPGPLSSCPFQPISTPQRHHDHRWLPIRAYRPPIKHPIPYLTTFLSSQVLDLCRTFAPSLSFSLALSHRSGVRITRRTRGLFHSATHTIFTSPREPSSHSCILIGIPFQASSTHTYQQSLSHNLRPEGITCMKSLRLLWTSRY